MRMRDVENMRGRRTWIALAWVVPCAVLLSMKFLPTLKETTLLMKWIPRVVVVSNSIDALLVWMCFALVSSGFLSVDFCRWRYRASQSALALMVLALAFFSIQSLLAYAVVCLAGGLP
jgi:hypothetical protein